MELQYDKIMRKILFVITTIGGGGAERVVSYLVNSFCKFDNCSVNLLLLKEEGNTYIDSIDDEVVITNLKLKKRLRYQVVLIVNAIIKLKPDICFIGLDGLNILLAPFVPLLKLFGIKIIVRETNVLSKMWNPTLINRFSYKVFYNQYDSIICQSFDMANDLINVWKINPDKITIINNPINIQSIQQQALKAINEFPEPQKPFFIAVGRLVPQKGFEQLIGLVHILKCKNKFPYKLLILGNGELRSKLDKQIQKLSLTDCVLLPGRIENPYRIMRMARGLFLSSKFEGFPNVLLEANALGIPVLANNCPGGINEIVINGLNGYIVDFDDIDAFEHCFDKFVSTSFDKDAIIELTFKRYDSSVILPKYINAFFK